VLHVNSLPPIVAATTDNRYALDGLALVILVYPIKIDPVNLQMAEALEQISFNIRGVRATRQSAGSPR
jgi:hypothetical protein